MSNVRETMASCFEQVAFFFTAGDPKSQESFAQRAKYLEGQIYERERLVSVLESYHQRLEAPARTHEQIALLREEKTLAVVTGQQAGLFTGPLYTLYKALTVIHLAEEQSLKLQRPVVPVFWVASEDHDWVEIRTATFLSEAGKPVRCSLSGDGGGQAVGRLPVPNWEEIRTQVLETLPPGRFHEEVVAMLEDLTLKAENLGEWFAFVLQWLLQERGLIFFDPLLPELKNLALPIYQRILDKPETLRQALSARTTEWMAQGYDAQIQLTGEEALLFLEMPERRALMWDGTDFYLRGQVEHWTTAEILALLTKEPERFSPNVVTRPIVQEFLLPVLAYVAGPGELNYWAQLGGVFQTLGFQMPILFPRLSAAALTPAWKRTLEKEHISLEIVYGGLAGHKERCVREQDAFDIDGRFTAAEDQIEKLYRDLLPLVGIHPNLGELLQQNEDKVRTQLNYLKNKVWQAQRKRCEQSLRRIQQLEDALCPLGSRQERVLNPLSFVVRYGRDFVERVAEIPLTMQLGEHVIVLD
ncbi:MAG: bacillithiol biosynthesis cysteine-adding enzyme BshC [Desulfitobacteriaceae bacterium]